MFKHHLDKCFNLQKRFVQTPLLGPLFGFYLEKPR